jgi:hypothetical protein
VNRIRQIAYPLLSVFLVYRTIALMKHLYFSSPIDFRLGESLLIALLITLFITGVFIFPGFVFPTSKVMPKRYWIPKHPQQLNSLFSILKVNTYKSILVLLFWGRKSNQKKYYNGTRKGLEAFNFETKQSEFGHLCALVFIVFASLLLLLKGYFVVVVLMTIINMLVNFYPIILQRHHRIRIYRLAEHLKA